MGKILSIIRAPFCPVPPRESALYSTGATMALLNYTNYQPISGAGAPLPINMDSVAVSVVDSHNMTMVIKWRGGRGVGSSCHVLAVVCCRYSG